MEKLRQGSELWRGLMSADWRGCAGGRYGGKRIPSRTESKRGVRCGAWCKILCKRKSTKSQRYDRSV